MTVVADAGPLIALAKVDGLDVLVGLYQPILIPPAVHAEAVEAGRELGAPDALALDGRLGAGQLAVRKVPALRIPVPAQLGPGEAEAILLAIEERAAWLLVDDLAARRAAESSFRAARVPTKVKGTLGVIVSAVRVGYLSAGEGIDLVAAIGSRPDIWVHERLCSQVIETLRRGAV